MCGICGIIADFKERLRALNGRFLAMEDCHFFLNSGQVI
jgi:hypothetical protein